MRPDPAVTTAAHDDAPTPPRGRRLETERHSLVAVLELIRSGRATTRLEIERLSGLGRAVVSDRLATLIELGLVAEGELGPAIGGRAPRLMRFRADAGRILVATLDHASIGVGLADLAGHLQVEHHEAADLALGPDPILRRLEMLFDWVLEQYPGRADVWGIGLGVPRSFHAPGDPRLGPERLMFAPNWDQTLAVERLVQRHRAPVWVRSLVQLMTVGELGAAPESRRDLLFVELGTEISAGLISDGRLHRGALGVAGRIGHISTADTTTVCRCGNTGCLEAVAGGEALVREALAAARDGRSRRLADTLETNGAITVTDIGFAAQLGDAFSAELLSRCGRLIGTVLGGLTNAFNPAAIVLGGELARTSDVLLAAVREAVYRHSDALVTRDLRIERSQMGGSAGLAGAALLAVEELFAPEMLGGWIISGSPLHHPDVTSLLQRVGQALRQADDAPPPRDGRTLRVPAA
ncbi:MAG TPA: ROK family protein [Acetobacteraceae bacterium]|nr:ROK family protein [Acetobacteraceae bacterium]